MTMVPQSLTQIHNYLSGSEWMNAQQSSMAALQAISTRLRLCGVKALKEDTKKWCTTLMVHFEMERAAGERPASTTIYRMSQEMATAFQCSQVEAKAEPLVQYPVSPLELGEAWLNQVYDPKDMPTNRDVPNLFILVKDHIPIRNTSALLTKEKNQLVPSSGSNEPMDKMMGIWQQLGSCLLQGHLPSAQPSPNTGELLLHSFQPKRVPRLEQTSAGGQAAQAALQDAQPAPQLALPAPQLALPAPPANQKFQIPSHYKKKSKKHNHHKRKRQKSQRRCQDLQQAKMATRMTIPLRTMKPGLSTCCKPKKQQPKPSHKARQRPLPKQRQQPRAKSRRACRSQKPRPSPNTQAKAAIWQMAWAVPDAGGIPMVAVFAKTHCILGSVVQVGQPGRHTWPKGGKPPSEAIQFVSLHQPNFAFAPAKFTFLCLQGSNDIAGASLKELWFLALAWKKFIAI